MIESFKCRETKRIFEGKLSLKFPHKIQNRALIKLRMIDAAQCLDDLRLPPSNRLERLKGPKKHLLSMRINDQWRICFIFQANGAYQVEICDYH